MQLATKKPQPSVIVPCRVNGNYNIFIPYSLYIYIYIYIYSPLMELNPDGSLNPLTSTLRTTFQLDETRVALCVCTHMCDVTYIEAGPHGSLI